MGDGRYRSSRCFHSPWSKLLPKIDTIFWRKSNIKSDLFSPPISNQNLPQKIFYILAVKIMLTPHQLNTFFLHKVLQLEAIFYSYRTFVRPLLEYSSILFPLAYSRQHYLWPNKATHWWSKTFYNWTSLRSLQSSEIFFILLYTKFNLISYYPFCLLCGQAWLIVPCQDISPSASAYNKMLSFPQTKFYKLKTIVVLIFIPLGVVWILSICFFF